MKTLCMRIIMLYGVLYATSSHALTAVCKEPIGRILGLHGKHLGEGRLLDEPDGMKGGIFTVIWNRGSNQAQVISQGSGGGEPLTETGIKVFESNEQVSFLVLYSSAVWLYSLFPDPKILLITSHNNGASIDVGGTVIKAFRAGCEVSE